MGSYVVFISSDEKKWPALAYSFKYSYMLHIFKQNDWPPEFAIELKIPHRNFFYSLDFVFSVKYKSQGFYVEAVFFF